jgi:amino acid permease
VGTKNALKSDAVTNTISTALLSAICFVACLCTEKDVGLVIGIIGAVLGTGVVYIIPAMLNTRLLPKAAVGERSLNRLLVLVGAVFTVVGTLAALQEHFPGAGHAGH